MATDPGTIAHLLDQLGHRGADWSTRRMFGEYCLYRAGLPVALVCDDTLFVKDTPAGREAMEATTPIDLGAPYPGARPHLRVPPDLWDDGDWLRGVLAATAAALPPPKPRATRASNASDAPHGAAKGRKRSTPPAKR